MAKNMDVPLIEVKDYRDGNIYAFEIMNVEWVLKGIVLRRLKISEATRMVANSFLKNGIPF